jgi:ubiquinone/menaquinone biosynthesis C-methylase UbiE
MKPESNTEWLAWAKVDPLFAISTVPGRERKGTHPWTLPEFYETGAVHWSLYRKEWRRYGLGFGTCLDLGCGAGRMTKHIAEDFGTVYGVDISPDMLNIARQNIRKAVFLDCDGSSIPIANNSVSAVFCVQVFQHLGCREMAVAYFREIYRVLSPGGTCLIQIPLIILPFERVWPLMSHIQRSLWGFSDAWLSIKATTKRWLIVHRGRKPFYRVLQYEPGWLFQSLSAIGFDDIHLSIFNATGVRGEEEPHLFLRK